MPGYQIEGVLGRDEVRHTEVNPVDVTGED